MHDNTCTSNIAGAILRPCPHTNACSFEPFRPHWYAESFRTVHSQQSCVFRFWRQNDAIRLTANIFCDFWHKLKGVKYNWMRMKWNEKFSLLLFYHYYYYLIDFSLCGHSLALFRMIDFHIMTFFMQWMLVLEQLKFFFCSTNKVFVIFFFTRIRSNEFLLTPRCLRV